MEGFGCREQGIGVILQAGQRRIGHLSVCEDGRKPRAQRPSLAQARLRPEEVGKPPGARAESHLNMHKPFFTHLEALAPRTRKVAASSLWEARRLTDDTPVDRRTTYVIAAALARADAERETNRVGEMHARTAAWALARTAEAMGE